MAQRQVFVGPLLQFELRKYILDAGIEALIVGNDHDYIPFGIQQLLAFPDHRQRVGGMFQDVKQRDDVILPREPNLIQRALMNWEAALCGNVLADVLRQVGALDFVSSPKRHVRQETAACADIQKSLAFGVRGDKIKVVIYLLMHRGLKSVVVEIQIASPTIKIFGIVVQRSRLSRS